MPQIHSETASEIVKPGEVVLLKTIEFAKEIFNLRLISCYALGSLAHGGFCPLVSDIDIAIILHDPVTKDDFQLISLIHNNIKQTALPLAERLSIFWGSIDSLQSSNSNVGRFPPLDKLDLIENGRILFGKDIRNILSKPTKSELVIKGAKFALQMLGTIEMIEEVHNPNLIYERGLRHLTKTILFPVRLLYTAFTSKIGHNEEAVNYYLSNYSSSISDLVKSGFDWRYQYPNNPTTAIQLLKKSIIPLYIQFIDVYHEEMIAYGEDAISRELMEWKKSLMK